jgi:site-specific recombinase XerD
VIEAIPEDRISRLLTELMYGTGMRVGEVCTLRLRDIGGSRVLAHRVCPASRREDGLFMAQFVARSSAYAIILL